MYDSNLEHIKSIITEQHEDDERQLEIVFSEEPRIIVEAPAGYGKTTTMISRIAYLYASGRIPNPKKVLGLTFSVNAALKIKREVAEKLPLYINIARNPMSVDERVTVTNFHGFCKSVLRKYGFLRSELLRKDINLMRAFGKSDIEKSSAIQTLLGYEDWKHIKRIEEQIECSQVPTTEDIKRYNDIIVQKLLAHDYITHDAVLLMTIELFLNFPKIKEFYSNYYPLIVVDEFQDTNCVAWELLKALISDKTQLLFLGDSLQRIYGFIGAVPNIMSIAENELSMRAIALNKNYRFRNNPDMLLLDANVRENAATGFNPYILENAKLPAFWGNSQRKEAEDVVNKIIRLNTEFCDRRIAILFRSRGDNAEVFEQVLQEKEIDYFYGMYTDEDDVYVDFHNHCRNAFVSRFGGLHSITKRQLLSFVKSIEESFLSRDYKAVSSLMALLKALVDKVNQNYSELQPSEKYELLLDIFENRQLKQSMEYVKTNLILATVHGAKGLEWDYVFVADLERFIFPAFTCYGCPSAFSEPTNAKCMQPKMFSEDKLNNVLNELSVFYVAVTRARKQAFVSASKKRANGKVGAYSCFSSIDGIKLVNGKDYPTV
ncbi:MAG: ATP-dependent helicase [Peptostreptococcaceae bacterium]|nr:ATP-dependent helicase [Peptostreptococcaceae bacterium]